MRVDKWKRQADGLSFNAVAWEHATGWDGLTGWVIYSIGEPLFRQMPLDRCGSFPSCLSSLKATNFSISKFYKLERGIEGCTCKCIHSNYSTDMVIVGNEGER